MPQISVNDLSIHYEESGEGLSVILIHGHPFDATMWLPQLHAAFPGHRLLAPELRNFGHTTSPNRPADFGVYARDILDFANSLSLDKFIVVGLSMGGQVALELASTSPERLAGLVLADTFAQLDTPEKKQWRYTLADRLDAEGLQAYAVEVLPKMLSACSISENPELASEVLLMMQRCPAQGAADALRVRAERRDYVPVLPRTRPANAHRRRLRGRIYTCCGCRTDAARHSQFVIGRRGRRWTHAEHGKVGPVQ